MKKKYIVIGNGRHELMFIFPEPVYHCFMLEAVQGIKMDAAGNRFIRPYRDYECVSAGFINDHDQCYGESESIGISARAAIDTALLKAGGQA